MIESRREIRKEYNDLPNWLRFVHVVYNEKKYKGKIKDASQHGLGIVTSEVDLNSLEPKMIIGINIYLKNIQLEGEVRYKAIKQGMINIGIKLLETPGLTAYKDMVKPIF